MNQEGPLQFVEEESGSGGKNLLLLAVLQFTICHPQQTPLLSPRLKPTF